MGCEDVLSFTNSVVLLPQQAVAFIRSSNTAKGSIGSSMGLGGLHGGLDGDVVLGCVWIKG